MTARLAMAPPLLTQARRPFVAMFYWIHARHCPLLYRARACREYRT